METKTHIRTEMILTKEERDTFTKAQKIVCDILEVCDKLGAKRGQTYAMEGSDDSIEKDELEWVSEYLDRLRWAYSVEMESEN